MPNAPGNNVEAADRAWTLQRLLNAREGFTKRDDEIPPQWLRPLEAEGKNLRMTDYFKTRTLSREDLDQLLKDYYEERGWDPATGYPSPEKLESLGLPIA